MAEWIRTGARDGREGDFEVAAAEYFRIVGDEQHGASSAKGFEKRAEGETRRSVEVVRHFVEDKKRGIPRQGACNRDLLDFAAGQRTAPVSDSRPKTAGNAADHGLGSGIGQCGVEVGGIHRGVA